MTHEQMSKFTHEELSNFSHLELSLDKTEILQNLINNFRDDIPSSVILKLERMSKNFINSCENNNIDIPSEIIELKDKSHLTFLEIVSILGTIITIISFATDMFSAKEKTINNTLNFPSRYFQTRPV